MSQTTPMATTPAGTASITVTSYAGTADVDVTSIKLRPQYWLITNSDAALRLHVSFDGTNDHAIIAPGDPRPIKAANEKKLWFKLSGAGTVNVSWSAMPAR